MAPLPACPTCRAELHASRLLQLTITEVGLAAGTDATADVWVATVSCPGCLAAIEATGWRDGGAGWTVREVTSSTAVARIRDRLAAARAGDSLDRELRALFSNPASAVLLGTLELFEFVKEAWGRTVRLRVESGAWPNQRGGESPGEPFPPRAYLVRALSQIAIPAGAADHFLVHEGTSLAVTGVREGMLLCELDGKPLLVSPNLVDP